MNGKSKAWEHHKDRNKHHPEYWMNKNKKSMPYNYLIESVCDRISACKTYNNKSYINSDPLTYWKKQKEKGYKLPLKIEKFYDVVLKDLSTKGEEILTKEYFEKIYTKVFK